MTTSFSDFALAPALLRGLEALGFTTPTPVQAEAIPLLLAGRDAIVMAKTGSGKTLAFGLPLLTMLKRDKKPQALVVCPTRELAQQIREAIASVSSEHNALRVLVLYGGVGLGPQEKALRDGADIIVGTPGRLKDLLGRGSLDLTGVTSLVLDEADEMLDKGFRRDIESLIDRLPARKQTLIFSATMPSEIEVIARRHLKDPAIVKLTTSQAVPTELTHAFVRVPSDLRLDALVALIRQEDPERALIFTRTKRETKILAKKLETYAGLEAGFLNGNMSQNARDTMLNRFRAGDFKYLVATDVAARGLDVEGLSHVFHFAVPTVVETYIHRSGRTGRAGNEGMTIILVTPDDDQDFRSITKRVKLAELTLDIPRLPRPEGAVAPRGPRTQRSLDPSLDDGTDNAPHGGRQAGAGRRGTLGPRGAVTGDRSRGLPSPAPRAPRPDERPVRTENAPRTEARPARTPRADEGGRAPQTAQRPTESGRPARAPRQPDAHASGDSAWRSFRMPLREGHDHSPESFRSWLSQRTRVSSTSLRAVKLHADHATFEVEAPVADRLLEKLRGAR